MEKNKDLIMEYQKPSFEVMEAEADDSAAVSAVAPVVIIIAVGLVVSLRGCS